MKISLKNKNGLNELLARIESIVNDDKIDLPLNYVYESPVTKLTMFNGKDSLTFVIIGDSTVGKTCFFNRYFSGSYNETTLNTIGVGKQSKIIKIFGIVCICGKFVVILL